MFLEQDTQPVLEQPDTEQPDPQQPNTEQPPPQLKSQLIGTSTERKDFLDQLQLFKQTKLNKKKQNAGEARLSAINKKIDKDEAESKLHENLRLSRLARVPEEPNPNEDHVLVCVCHVSLGPLSRKFSEDATLSNVYDWVGSLSCTPKNFTLSKNPKEVLFPDESVGAASASVLCMTEIEVLSVPGETGGR